MDAAGHSCRDRFGNDAAEAIDQAAFPAGIASGDHHDLPGLQFRRQTFKQRSRSVCKLKLQIANLQLREQVRNTAGFPGAWVPPRHHPIPSLPFPADSAYSASHLGSISIAKPLLRE